MELNYYFLKQRHRRRGNSRRGTQFLSKKYLAKIIFSFVCFLCMTKRKTKPLNKHTHRYKMFLGIIDSNQNNLFRLMNLVKSLFFQSDVICLKTKKKVIK